jgi:hypothetical protein
VSSSNDVRPLELILFAFYSKNVNKVYKQYIWARGLSIFHYEVNKINFFENKLESFMFNYFAINTFNIVNTKLILFSQPVYNFYLEEPIAIQSNIIAECALFLGQDNNFISER